MKKGTEKKPERITTDANLYFRIIENYFTAKIQKIADIPAEPPFLYLNEMGVIHEWHDKEIPLEVVFTGIDRAFHSPSKAPESLSDCKVLVEEQFEKWRKDGRHKHSAPHKQVH